MTTPGPQHPDWIPTFRPSLGKAELDRLREVFESGWLGAGPLTHAFEKRLASVTGAKHVVAVNSGTAALQLALEAIGLESGDEVLVPSLTFCGSVQAILAAGGIPVFCEVRADDLCIDVLDATQRITARTRAVMPVHYGGVVCSVRQLAAVCRPRGIRVIADAAHAFGSTDGADRIGRWADATCFSFDPLKNITCGDGGAVATDDDELARRVALRRQLGIDLDSWSRTQRPSLWRYAVVDTGHRMHMNQVAAAIGMSQLDRWEQTRDRKRELVVRYDAALARLPEVTCLRRDLRHSFPFSYVVRVHQARRDELVTWLYARNIGAMVQFIPNHLQPAFAHYSRGTLPRTEQLFEEIVTLPLFADLTVAEQSRVIKAVIDFIQLANHMSPASAAPGSPIQRAA